MKYLPRKISLDTEALIQMLIGGDDLPNSNSYRNSKLLKEYIPRNAEMISILVKGLNELADEGTLVDSEASRVARFYLDSQIIGNIIGHMNKKRLLNLRSMINKRLKGE